MLEGLGKVILFLTIGSYFFGYLTFGVLKAALFGGLRAIVV